VGELRRLRPLIILAGMVLVAGVLYWGRSVVMPLAIATLLTFLLSPLVTWFQRRGLTRALSVVLVVVMAFVTLGGIGWILFAQVENLAEDLPLYRGNIMQKISDLRNVGRGTAFERVQRLLDDVVGEIRKQAPAEKKRQDPVPVIVQPDTPTVLRQFLHLVDPLVTIALVLALVVFMLLRQAELRNRLIHIGGHGQLPVTTKAIDEAAERISHYLLMQSMINGAFGVAIGLGLFLIGVPYAILWGFLAGVLRFVPYLGPWLAALMPITLSLAVFQGWLGPTLVIGLFVVIEPLIFMVIEPLLYGNSAGVSEVPLLVAVGFWTWLWGPVGLILATPMTVCLVVIGRYVPELEFMAVLLSDEPVLEPHVGYYQRLLAGDDDEAAEIVEAFMAENPPEEVYDRLLLPALRCIRRDADAGRLTEEDEEFALAATREIVEGLGPRGPEAAPADDRRPGDREPAFLLGAPARDEVDWLGLLMLQRLLGDACRLEVASPDLLSAEVIQLVAERQPALVCVACVPPGGVAHARYLVKRLRQAAPEVKIVVGRWGKNGQPEQTREQLLAAGADVVGSTLLETRDLIRPLLPSIASAGSSTTRVA
jgi:predicted PurR-regulated permease PerM